MEHAPSPTAPSADPRPLTRQLADAVLEALSAPQFSLEAVRNAAVRYGRAARDLALGADDMLAALTPQVCRRLDALPSPRRAELVAQVEWWTVHGYHRAD